VLSPLRPFAHPCAASSRDVATVPVALETQIAALRPVACHQQRFAVSAARNAGFVSEREAREMYDLAATLRNDLLAWLRKEHPRLLPR
jgi:hypothetical protein